MPIQSRWQAIHTRIERQRTWWLVWGLILCWFVLITGGMAWRAPRWSVFVDIGNEGPLVDEGLSHSFQQFFGFLEAEQASDGSGNSFRWTSGSGAITFAGAQRLEPLVIDVLLCGCRPGSAPLTTTIELNNQPMAQIRAPVTWRRYTILVPPPLPHPDYGVMLFIRSPLATTQEGRQVGVAVDSIRIQQLTRQPLTTLNATLVAIMVSAAFVWWCRRLAPAIFFTLLWLAAAWYLYRPQLLLRDHQLIIVSAGMFGLWWVGRRARWMLVVSGLIAGLLLGSTQLLGRWILDDAFISFRYAQNLINGRGLVFNVGERVEGYTNFLWTIIIACGAWFGGDPVVIAGTLTLVLAFIIIGMTILLATDLTNPTWAWLPGLLVTLSSPFLLYTSRGSGMETALFTALLLTAIAFALQQRLVAAGLFTTLTMLTRPDGVLLAVALGLFALLSGYFQPGSKGVKSAWNAGLRYGIPLLLTFGPYFAWRWSYYGYPLPNTFYAKVGTGWAQIERGIAYTSDFALSSGVVLMIPIMVLGVVAALWHWRNTANRSPQDRLTLGPTIPVLQTIPLLLFTLLYTVYIVYVGGDHFPGFRFFVPLIPILALCTYQALTAVAPASSRLTNSYYRLKAGTTLVLWALVLGFTAVQLPASSFYTPGSRVRGEHLVAEKNRELGRWLRAATPPNTIVATGIAGALPYYSGLYVIDTLGLNDLHIAHLKVEGMGSGVAGAEKTDIPYILSRHPDYIPFGSSGSFMANPQFNADYVLLERVGPEGRGLQLYQLRSKQST